MGALASCQQLRKVGLSFVSVGDKSVRELVAAVTAMPALETFEMMWCECPPAVFKLQAALSTHASVRSAKADSCFGLSCLPLLAAAPGMRELRLVNIDVRRCSAACGAAGARASERHVGGRS